jgi:hypothetical protein
MSPSSIFMIATAILLLLLLLWAGREEEPEPLPRGGMRNGPRETLHPRELVRRIFSREDREFVFQMKSARLRQVYEEERRRLALHWIRQTASEVRRILREHRLASRQSKDLDVSTEAGLFFQYVQLRFLCGLLVVLVRLFGPHALQDLATYAGELQQRIAKALPEGGAANRLASSHETGYTLTE